MWRFLLTLLLPVAGFCSDDVSTVEVGISTVEESQSQNATECERLFDGMLDWPISESGQTAWVRCPVLKGYPNPTMSASRECHQNASWADKADYGACIKEVVQTHEKNVRMLAEQKNKSYIYIAGYALSNIFMIAAVIIFFKYKRLRCLRNQIHCNLLVAMICKQFVWFAMYGITYSSSPTANFHTECKVVISIHKIFKLAQYSWMFIEGLYLFLVVVRGQLISIMELKHYIAIGWGFPIVVGTAWVMMNAFGNFPPEDPRNKCWTTGDTELTAERALESISIICLLIVNFIFMVAVVVTLVKKLQQSPMGEHKQYIKAVKATILLLILLGGVYLVLTIEVHHSWITGVTYTIAFVQSTQGFAVALIYCFLNGEVQVSLKKSLDRWRDERTLPSGLSQWLQKRRRSSGANIHHRDSTVVETLSNSRRNSKQTSSEHIDINSNSHVQPYSTPKPISSLAIV